MLFVVTSKWAADKTPELARRSVEQSAKERPKGLKVIASYTLLGRCQVVEIVEARDEKAIFQYHAPWMDIMECDWAPAMASDELLKVLSE